MKKKEERRIPHPLITPTSERQNTVCPPGTHVKNKKLQVDSTGHPLQEKKILYQREEHQEEEYSVLQMHCNNTVQEKTTTKPVF